MKLALLTYDIGHLKTEQIALGLAERGHRDLTLITIPFHPRPSRTFARPHRPDMRDAASPQAVATATGAKILSVDEPAAIPTHGFDFYLVTGVGLLPASFVSATLGRVINAHPGMIPLVRGLDAFKWAILDDMPMGNSLHFIDAEADAGELLRVIQTPVLKGDTYERLARRHYEREIAMMIDFERHLNTRSKPSDLEPRPARKRMNAETETMMIAGFDKYVARHSAASYEFGQKERVL